ncbi:ATP-dependent endonuclease, partial [Vibrio cholerae]|nr:ATP-dependent endonuclease [Vibrio cholerae]
VSVKNFEDSHNYSHDAKKGKPLSAWEFAQNLDIAGDASIVSFIRQIVGIDQRVTEFTQEYLEEVVIEKHQIEA